MTQTFSLRNPLQSIFILQDSLIQKIMIVVAGSFLLAIASKITLPLTPVPMTLQSLAVFIIASVVGWRLAGLTIAAYLIEGLVGLPVFAAATIATAGYLVGFLFAGIAMAWLIENGWGRFRTTTAFAALIGTIILYAFGLIWLAHIVGFSNAITVGLKPFLLVDSCKIILIALFAPLFWRS